MVRKNQPHSSATALGHIIIARSGIRSSRPKNSASKAFATTRSQAKPPVHQPHYCRPNESAHPAYQPPAYKPPAYQPPAYQLRSHQTLTINNNLAHQQKSMNVLATINRPSSLPQRSKPGFYRLRNSAIALYSPTSRAGSPAPQWMSLNISCSQSTSATFT